MQWLIKKAVRKFLKLDDTPAAFTGAAGKASVVNAGEDALEFSAPAPKAHKTTHENAGADEISIAGLSGEAADDQPPKAHIIGGAAHSADTLANLNLKVSDADLVPKASPVITGEATIPTIALTGGQIAFPAEAVPSADPNTIDDYEEGTFTGVITDLTNPATMDASYTTGSYIKIGNVVTIAGRFVTTSLGSMTGGVKLAGLPFAGGTGNSFICAINTSLGLGLNITAGYNVAGQVGSNEAFMGFYIWDVATGTSGMTAAEWSDDGSIVIGGSYLAD